MAETTIYPMTPLPAPSPCVLACELGPPSCEADPNCAVYVGAGIAQDIVGFPVTPDLVWAKRISRAASHYWFDIHRGVGNYIKTDQNIAEESNVDSLTAFLSAGFSLGAPFNGLNQLDEDYWAYVLAEELGFFDITTYTGESSDQIVSHGLGVPPELMIIKCIDYPTIGTNWRMYWSVLDIDESTVLNLTSVVAVDSGFWVGYVPDATTFKVGDRIDVRQNNQNFVAYLFASKSGKSKVGMYIGDTTSGPIVIPTDFRPRFMLVKNGDEGTRPWLMHSTCYDPVNPHTHYLKANDTTDLTDFGSPILNFNADNVEILTTSPAWNETGFRFFYMVLA